LKALKKKYKMGERSNWKRSRLPKSFDEKSSTLEKKIWPTIDKRSTRLLTAGPDAGEGRGESQKDIMKRCAARRRPGKIEKGAPEHLAIYRDKLTRRIAEVLTAVLWMERVSKKSRYFAERAISRGVCPFPKPSPSTTGRPEKKDRSERD